MRILLLLLVCGQANAATYYLDPTSVNGGSGSQGSPFNNWSDITLADGDTVYGKAGTTLKEFVQINDKDNFTLAIYGGTSAFTIDGESTRDEGLEIINSSGWQVRDWTVKNHLDNNITVRCDYLNTCTFTQPAFLRVTADYACPVVASGSGATDCIGFLIIGQNSAGDTTCCGVYSGFEMRTVSASYNGGMGVHFYHARTASGQRFKVTTGSVFRGNGALKIGGNVWLHSPRQETSSLTWVSAGTCTACWNLTWGAQIDVQRVIYQNPAPDEELTEGTFDSLTAGQYADNGTNVLQVRLSTGATANGKSIQAVMGYTAFLIEDNFLYDSQSSDSSHGWSLALDDEASNAIIRRNYIEDAEGPCITAMGGQDNTFESNILHNCGTSVAHDDGRRSCIWLGEQHTHRTNIFNNTIHQCGRSGVHIGATGVTVNISDTIVMTNNIMDQLGSYGIVLGRQSLATERNNNIYAATVSAVQDIGGNLTTSGRTTVNPLFLGGTNPTSASGFRPLTTSPLIRAGTPVALGMDDYFGFNVEPLPTIGAIRGPSPRSNMSSSSRVEMTSINRVTLDASNRIEKAAANTLRLQ